MKNEIPCGIYSRKSNFHFGLTESPRNLNASLRTGARKRKPPSL